MVEAEPIQILQITEIYFSLRKVFDNFTLNLLLHFAMTLKELYTNTTWPSVREELFSLYPDQKKKETGYQKVYEQMPSIGPQKSTTEILFTFIEEKEPEYDSYIHLSGIETNSDSKESHSLELTSWEEWMGMSINETTLNDFSPPNILAHCLLEMTLTGFDPETRKRTEDDMVKRSMEISKGS
ncbi:hypothetical protein DFO77_11622 [Marinilabilia salmonicolor]|uniref:Uncharacterized protein n=2 Tax=Marinilabilia salmonicolor TaxID=989 RepID=A0A368UV47_9BACT|nr:hypothetical protein DFO77_11622 [Marinilabilia salmonicolor]